MINSFDKYIEPLKAQSNQGLIEFEGYSASEMDNILNDTFEQNGIIQINKLSDDSYNELPILNQIKYLGKLLEEKEEIKLTQAGYLPPKIVKDIYQKGFLQEEYLTLANLRKEEDSVTISLTKFLLELSGVTKKRNNKLSLTKKGQTLLSDNHKLLQEILSAYIYNFNWGYFDGYANEDIGKLGAGFSLILLTNYGNKKELDVFYAEKYFSAFANLLGNFSTKEDLEGLYSCYTLRTFQRFFEYFGFVKIEEGIMWDSKRSISKTKLFDKLFTITPPKSSSSSNIFNINGEKVGGSISMIEQFKRVISETENIDFNSEDDLKNHLQDMVDDETDEEYSSEFEAQELVYDAYDLPPKEGIKLVNKALELNPNNAEAYIYLATQETDTEKAKAKYIKALMLAENSLGDEIFEEDKGHFWGIHETRPYMTAKAGVAKCLYYLGEIDMALFHYQEMLELNPNDNQGVRYIISTLLLEYKLFDEYEALLKQYNDEGSPEWLFSIALYKFIKEGKSKNAKKAFYEAHKANKFVIEYIIGIREFPEDLPQFMTFGGEDEAIHCAIALEQLWKETNGALDWMRSFYRKSHKIK